jgi:hypothetical protein
MPAPTTPGAKDAALKSEARRLRAQAQAQFRELESLRRRLAALSGEIEEGRSVTIHPVGLARRTGGLPRPGEVEPTTPWWPTTVYPESALVPPPGLASLSLREKECPVLGFIVLGMDPDSLKRMVDLVSAAQLATMNFIPVFFTDSPDFSVFRRYGYVFEYVLAVGASATGERLDYLKRKWGVHSTIDLRETSDIDLSAIPVAEEPDETLVSSE